MVVDSHLSGFKVEPGPTLELKLPQIVSGARRLSSGCLVWPTSYVKRNNRAKDWYSVNKSFIVSNGTFFIVTRFMKTWVGLSRLQPDFRIQVSFRR